MYSENTFPIPQMLKIGSNFSKCDVFIVIPVNFSAFYFCYWGYPLSHCGLNDRKSWRWLNEGMILKILVNFMVTSR